MKISVENNQIDQSKAEMVVLGLIENEEAPFQALDKEIQPKLAELIKQKRLKTEHGETFVAPLWLGNQSLMVVGLGKIAELNLEKIRLTGGKIAQIAKEHQVKSVAIDGASFKFDCFVAEAAGRALAEGLILGNYHFAEYKSKEDQPPVDLEQITVIVSSIGDQKSLTRALKQAEVECEAVIFTRDLVNRPASHLHPGTLKAVAEKIAQASAGLITATIFDRAGLQKLGAGAILGVAAGSEFEPYLIHLEYKPTSKKHHKSIALVGKGVTFDSGGLSLKPAEAMEDMKSDMAGAALVLGVFSALPRIKPNVTIHGIIPAVENMPSDRAMRVGDIIKTLSGKTVEVLNTDAEGRLILADALTYAERLTPDFMIDFATLTGACIVALGDQIAGLMTKSDHLKSRLFQATEYSGEKLWELPLPDEYKEKMKSEVADLSNVHKGRAGGAIMGGLFLQEFVKNVPWAHLDIAGPSFNRQALNSYSPAGATGFGVRTICYLLNTMGV